MLHLPELLPDEFLGGYVGRIARCNGSTWTETRKRLNAQASAMAGSASNRSATQTIAVILRAEPDDLAREHTLLPLVRAVRRGGATLRHADLTQAGVLKLHEFRLHGKAPHFCTSCVNEDLNFWGASYWRRSHQARGILHCLKHDEPLRLAQEVHGLQVHPEECNGHSVTAEVAGSDTVQDRYRQIAAAMLELKQAIPADQAAYRLSARIADVPRPPNKQRGPLWQIIHSVLRTSALGQIFPPQSAARTPRSTAGAKPAGGWDIYGVGYSLAIAMAALYPTADEAMRDVFSRRPRDKRIARIVMPTDAIAFLNY